MGRSFLKTNLKLFAFWFVCTYTILKFIYGFQGGELELLVASAFIAELAAILVQFLERYL